MIDTIVEDIKLKNINSTNYLINQFYKSGGFTAKKVAQGLDIIEEMIKEKECIKFLSFPACICSTGTRGVIKDLLKNKLVDIVITTAGTLDHDLARIWENYYHGKFNIDDKKLHREGINRLGNILIPNKCYGLIIEKKIYPLINDLYKIKKRWSTKDIIWEIGKRFRNEKNIENSIIYWSWKNKIPIFIPGITDGAIGYQLWMFYQENKDFVIDILADEQNISDIIFNAKKSGAIIIGGGISKHHTIWWNQFKGGLDYAVYITTAVEYDGSLSGAKTREAISWGKINKKANTVSIDGDATVLFPLIISALYERLNISYNK
jgi:deoxyhypusine synthase